jgi:hypothetical protein
MTLGSAFLALSLVACTVKSYPPEAIVMIRADAATQADVFAVTRVFGKNNGFTVLESNSLPRKGRLVPQMMLKRTDGVFMSMDNFMDVGTLEVIFWVEKPQANWLTSEKAWEGTVLRAVGDRGVVTHAPIK